MTPKTHICRLPGNDYTDSEWCREYCLLYGTGKCRYDPEIRKCVVEDDEGESP